MNEFVLPVDLTSTPIGLARTSRRDPAATRQKWVERIDRFRDSMLTVAKW